MSENKPKEFVVYRIYHIESSKSYIGITVDYKRRIRNHFNVNNNTYIHNAINKYGKDKFKYEIVFECNSWKELCKEEIEYIRIFNTKAPNGYNCTNGGDGTLGFKFSKEACKKRTISQIGRKFSKEACKKMSESQKGKIISEETKEKLSKINKKFSNNQILEIKQMLFNGVPPKDIAKKFNVHRVTISCIKTGKHYSEIQCPNIDLNNLPKNQRKLTNNQIIEIRKMLLNGIFQKIIAKRFNVCIGTIRCIKQNKFYADIQLPKETI